MEFTVRFDPTWTLFDWKGQSPPAATFLERCKEKFGAGCVQVIEQTNHMCSVRLDLSTDAEALKKSVQDILKMMDVDQPDKRAKLIIASGKPASQPQHAPQTPSDGQGADETGAKSSEEGAADVLEQIRRMPGREQFKELAEELALVAAQPEATALRSAPRALVFSINTGDGYHDMLDMYAKLQSQLHPGNTQQTHELTLEVESDRPMQTPPIEALLDTLQKTSIRNMVVSFDICNWISRTNTNDFKRLLLFLERNAANSTLIFRIPFVEPHLIKQISEDIGDILLTRAVVVPPMTTEELKLAAEQEFTSLDYTVNDDAWQTYHDKIAEEKMDGTFYGVRTVKKVVNEIVYAKALQNAKAGASDRVISPDDIAAVIRNAQPAGRSGAEQLEGLVGIDTVKQQLMEIVAHLRMAQRNPAFERPAMHMRFVGNPGTGKTTVARILGRMLKEAGLLRVGRFYEIKGRDLCGQYVGHTAPKTTAVCRDAYGSVLFIDEAYALGDGSPVDYGREAISTLIAEMENHRDDLVVIFAGYPREMDFFLKTNAGLETRIPHLVTFPNYTRDELFKIFQTMAARAFHLDGDALEAAQMFFRSISDDEFNSPTFGNARLSRNFYESCCRKLSVRQFDDVDGKPEMTQADVAAAIEDYKRSIPKSKNRIGFGT